MFKRSWPGHPIESSIDLLSYYVRRFYLRPYLSRTNYWEKTYKINSLENVGWTCRRWVLSLESSSVFAQSGLLSALKPHTPAQKYIMWVRDKNVCNYGKPETGKAVSCARLENQRKFVLPCLAGRLLLGRWVCMKPRASASPFVE